MWTEADGLSSELARAVTIAANGNVIIATGAGAAIWDGKTWTFPADRSGSTSTTSSRPATARSGWPPSAASPRGTAASSGGVDTRRGLAENHILDIATDQYDRLWARGRGSLTLISQ